MGPLAGKQSAIERRLKELKKESELVRGDIKVLSKAIKNPDDLSASPPRLKSTRGMEPAVRPPSRRDPVRTAQEPPPPANPGDGDLFDVAGRAGEPGKIQVPGAVPYGARPPRAEAAAEKKVVSKDERFANYFSSGNFLGAKPLRQEKNVQRNKAIFMMVIVIVVAFSVYRLLFK